MCDQNTVPRISSSDSIMESLEQRQKFKLFIEQFFKGLSKHEELKATGMFTTEESRQELVAKVATILHSSNTEEL